MNLFTRIVQSQIQPSFAVDNVYLQIYSKGQTSISCYRLFVG